MHERLDIDFISRGTTCRAWFYAAQHEGRMDERGVPCIVMAHGLGGTRDNVRAFMWFSRGGGLAAHAPAPAMTPAHAIEKQNLFIFRNRIEQP